MTEYLIKRNFDSISDRIFGNNGEWFCETQKGSRPGGTAQGVEDGSTIYIAETGFAIFAKGTINSPTMHKFEDLGELSKFIMTKSKVKDDSYWIEKLKDYYNNTEDFTRRYYVFEYKIIEIESFNQVYPLFGKLREQFGFKKLDQNFRLKKQVEQQTFLKGEIPSKIRMEVYNSFRIDAKEHLIDIDHFVPKSIGGPGNIIENLEPIGSSLNRYKSDSIPRKLFDQELLKKLFTDESFSPNEKRVLEEIKNDKKYFYKGPQYIELGKKIVSRINELDEAELRAIYKEIRNYHCNA